MQCLKQTLKFKFFTKEYDLGRREGQRSEAGKGERKYKEAFLVTLSLPRVH
jgi:hypothetical protein